MRWTRGLVFYGVAGTMTRRIAGMVIAAQALAVFFGALVARAIAAAGDESSSGALMVAGGLVALLCLLAAASMRRPWGVTLGWLLQLATLACAVVVPMMLVVGALFLAIWVSGLAQGAKIDAYRSGVDEAWYAEHPESRPGPPGR